MQGTNRSPRFSQHVEAIRQAAEKACISNSEIAAGTGLSEAAISRTMRGESRKPATIRRIRGYLASLATDPVADLVTPEVEDLQVREGAA